MLKNCINKKIYYVHNLTFEGFVFLKELISLKIKFKIVMKKKIIYALDIFWDNKIIKLRCSYRLTLLPLDKLSILAGEKKHVFPYNILNNSIKKYMKISEKDFNSKNDYIYFIKKWGHWINTDKIIEIYCKNDVIITKKSVIEYWKLLNYYNIVNNGKLLTAAGISIYNYFKNNNYILKKIDISLDNILRKAYFGGRTEVFGNPYNNEKILHFDFPGMYASVMKEKIPNGFIYISNKKFINCNKPGFYHISFKQEMNIPILPIKEDKLYFKNGIYEGIYWYEEILFFLDNGGLVINIYKAILFESYSKCISKFIKTNDKIRLKGGLYKQIGKNNNNTFYGRIGMNTNEINEEILNNIDFNFNKYTKVETINDVIIGFKKQKTKRISNVSVAACITSKARIKLYKGFIDVANNGGRVLYCDTDSIIAAFPKEIDIENKYLGESNIIFDTNLNDTEIKDAVFALPKTYGIHYKNNKKIVKIKGFNKKIEFNKFKWYFYNKKILNDFKKIFVKKNFEIELSTISITINLNNLNKRLWNSDLKSTKPLYKNFPIYNK